MGKLWEGDIKHTGDLLRLIRERRGMTQNHIARLAHVSNTTISRLELGYKNHMSRKTVKKYVEVLQSEASGSPRLSSEQAKLILDLHSAFKERMAHEKLLSTINFGALRRRQPPELGRLIALLETMEAPAFIFDLLWCVHALNGAALNLFEISPDSDHLDNWDAWHSLGSKFRTSSPIRMAHVNADTSFPLTVVDFFQNKFTRPFMFTTQMRHLVHRLHQLSEQNEARFTSWWLNAVTFSHEFTGGSLLRQIRIPKGTEGTEASECLTEATYRDSVPLAEGYDAAFILGYWKPVGAEAKYLFKAISGKTNSREVYYAADYDRDFHPNTWPEVRESLT